MIRIYIHIMERGIEGVGSPLKERFIIQYAKWAKSVK